MSKINLGRVLLGGLAAGVLMSIGEFLFNGVIYAQKMQDWAKQNNLPQVSDSFVLKAVALTLLAGIVAVFTYAAIRPRFGPGAKTAVIAGFILWFGYYFYAGLLMAFLGYAPMDVTVIGLVWGIVELPLATVIGAWLYKE